VWAEPPLQALVEYELVNYTGNCGYTVTDSGTAVFNGSTFTGSPVTFTLSNGPSQNNLATQTITYPSVTMIDVNAVGTVTFVLSYLIFANLDPQLCRCWWE
jgi:hypothetical protein